MMTTDKAQNEATETNEENQDLEVVFAPGCFDEFDGTQEELDELIKGIMEAVQTGELFENSVAFDDLPEDEQAELFEKFGNLFDEDGDEVANKRKLN